MEDNGWKLYTMDTKKLSDEAYFKKCYNSLSACRKEKTDSCRLWDDKKRSVGAGLLLDKGLREYGLREAKVRFAQGENGKPYLVDYPGIHFNLAHSGHMVLAAFADREVGCDIEKIKTANLRLAKRFFCPGEYAYLLSLEEKEQNRGFYRLWTLKESFLKVTGRGIRMPLDSFAFDISKDNQGILLWQEYDGRQYECKEYDFGTYHAAVCLVVN